MKPIFPLIYVLFFGIAGFAASNQTPDQFLENLYLREHRPTAKPQIDFGKRESVSKYFNPELTKLFLKNAECEKRTGEICNLDFDPIYDAQDMEDKTTNLKVAKVKGQESQFAVTFTNLDTRTLIYTLQQTKEGWRISDIKYSSGESLKAILSGKSH